MVIDGWWIFVNVFLNAMTCIKKRSYKKTKWKT